MNVKKLLKVMVLLLTLTAYPVSAQNMDNPTGNSGVLSENDEYSGSFRFGPINMPINESFSMDVLLKDDYGNSILPVPGRNRDYTKTRLRKIVLALNASLSGHAQFDLDLANLTLNASVFATGDINGSADLTLNVQGWTRKLIGNGWKVGDWTTSNAKATITGSASGHGSVAISCDDLSLDLKTQVSVTGRVTNINIYHHEPLRGIGHVFPNISWNIREGYMNSTIEPHMLKEINGKLKPELNKVEKRIEDELDKLIDKVENSGIIGLLQIACNAIDVYDDYVIPITETIQTIPFPYIPVPDIETVEETIPDPVATPIPVEYSDSEINSDPYLGDTYGYDEY